MLINLSCHLDISSWVAISIRLALFTAPLTAQLGKTLDQSSGANNEEAISLPIEQSLIKAKDEAQLIAKVWENHWDHALGDNLYPFSIYSAMSYAGIVCAVLTLLFFMMQWAKDLNEGNLSRPLSELIWPILVTILLTPNPIIYDGWNGLAHVTKQIRAIFSNAEVLILNVPGLLPPDTSISSEGKLEFKAPTIRSSFQDANAITSSQAMIQSYISKCFDSSGQEQMACLDSSIKDSVNLLKTYQDVYDRPIKWMAERSQELEELNEKLEQMYQQKSASAGSSQSSDSIEGKRLSPSDFPVWMIGKPQSEIRQLLQGGSMGFRQMLEIAFLGTALVGPIALGCSLLPVPIANKTITTWFSGFCAIGFTKITYAIIVGIASSVLIQSAPVDTTWFYTFLTFLAPMIAVGLATGGGLALSGALNQAASPLIR